MIVIITENVLKESANAIITIKEKTVRLNNAQIIAQIMEFVIMILHVAAIKIL
jgi:hypothetical protein